MSQPNLQPSAERRICAPRIDEDTSVRRLEQIIEDLRNLEITISYLITAKEQDDQTKVDDAMKRADSQSRTLPPWAWDWIKYAFRQSTSIWIPNKPQIQTHEYIMPATKEIVAD